jgi:hypothetical protein
LYVATATNVDCPLLGTTDASAYAPFEGFGADEVVLVVVVLVVVVVVVDGVADPPMTVAIGAHHPANASPQVTTTLPVPIVLLWPPGLVDMIAPEGLTVAHRRTNPVV